MHIYSYFFNDNWLYQHVYTYQSEVSPVICDTTLKANGNNYYKCMKLTYIPCRCNRRGTSRKTFNSMRGHHWSVSKTVSAHYNAGFSANYLVYKLRSAGTHNTMARCWWLWRSDWLIQDFNTVNTSSSCGFFE